MCNTLNIKPQSDYSRPCNWERNIQLNKSILYNFMKRIINEKIILALTFPHIFVLYISVSLT